MSVPWQRMRAGLPPERWYRPIPRRVRRLLNAAAVGAMLAFVVVGWLILGTSRPSVTTLSVLLGIGVPLLAVSFAWLVITLVGLSRAVSLIRPAEEARELLATGAVDEAALKLDEMCRRSRFASALHALLVYNRGVAFLRQGDPERAVSLISAALTSGWPGSRGLTSVLPAMVTGLAAAYVLRGDVEEATALQEQARQLLPAVHRGTLLLVDVLIETRAGRPAEAHRRFEELGALAESSLGLSDQRALCATMAFAGTQLEQTAQRRKANETFLRAARSDLPGELAYLGARWPEMAEFLRDNGLAEPKGEAP